MSNEKTLMGAILAVQAEVPNLKLGRDAEGQIQSRKYKYLTLDKLHGEILPLLSRNGLVWITRPLSDNGSPSLHYRLILAADIEQGIEGSMPLFLGEQTMQAYGSALSYAARYALLRVLGIAPTGEDDDGAEASKVPRPRRPPAPEIVPTEIKPSPEDRMLTDEELSILEAAVKDTPKANLALLLASEGVDSANLLTVPQARRIFKKLGISK